MDNILETLGYNEPIYEKGERIKRDLKNYKTRGKEDNNALYKLLFEIVLWKLNRSVEIKEKDLKSLLESSGWESLTENLEKAKKLLKTLLNRKGIQLPMASTILHFFNECLFPIIDKRACYQLHNEGYAGYENFNLQSINKEILIDLYFKYINDCKTYVENMNEEEKIEFSDIDKYLYQKHKNNHRLNNDLLIENVR